MARASRSYSKSSSSIASMMWPANLTTAYDYLHMQIVTFTPSSQVIVGGTNGTSSTPTTTGSQGTLPAASTAISFVSDIQTRANAQSLGDIYLPIPEGLNYTDAPQWSEESIGAVGKLLPSAAKNLLNGDASASTDAIQAMASGGKVGMIAKIVEGMGFSINALTQGIDGKVMNPYTEQIFKGIGMRTFQFSWKLVPRSSNEQQKIDEMITKIRAMALPDYAGALGGGAAGEEALESLEDRWLKVPNIFRLTWKTTDGSEIRSIPKIKPCVCTNVQVSYAPDNVWATHMINNKPYPVAYNLTMSFSETEIITSKDVSDKGY